MVKPRLLPILLLLASFPNLECAVAEPVAEPSIGIGGGEADEHTHLLFEGIPQGARIVRVSTRLIVEKVAPKGLNFFAVQVNFPNNTWAHGGPQVNTGEEKANWGGLVNRGGGAKDYQEVNWEEDLKRIEHGIGKPNTVPWKWDRNAQYILTIERGQQVRLPPGIHAQTKVSLPERVMWEWKLTIQPVTPGREAFTSLLYNSADHISSFYLWNEAGYGSTSKEQHSRWSLPRYRIEGSAEDKVPGAWRRF